MLSVGFTGTQRGLAADQRERLITVLRNFYLTEFHHGDCKGADEQAHSIMQTFAVSPFRIIIHPPDKVAKRAFCSGGDLEAAKPYLVRNRDIVNACDILVACPATMEEVLRSGTWSTLRYARKQGKKTIIIFPDGSLEWPRPPTGQS